MEERSIVPVSLTKEGEATDSVVVLKEGSHLEAGSAADKLQTLIRAFLDVRAMSAAAIEESQSFPPVGLECSTRASMLLSLLINIYPDKDDDYLPDGRPLVDAEEVPVHTMLPVLKTMVPLQIVATSLGIVSNAFANGEAVVDAALTPSVKNACLRLAGWPELDWASAASAQVAFSGWSTPVENLKAWWVHFNVARPQIYRLAVANVASAVHDAALQMPALPQYGHYLSDTVYNRALVKRHLLPESVKAGLCRDLLQVKRLKRNLEALYADFHLSPGIDKDRDFATA